MHAMAAGSAFFLVVNSECVFVTIAMLIRVAKISKPRPAVINGHLQGILDRLGKDLTFWTAKFCSGFHRMDFSCMKSFASINIPNANDDFGIHDEAFDRNSSAPTFFKQVRSQIGMIQRLRA